MPGVGWVLVAQAGEDVCVQPGGLYRDQVTGAWSSAVLCRHQPAINRDKRLQNNHSNTPNTQLSLIEVFTSRGLHNTATFLLVLDTTSPLCQPL